MKRVIILFVCCLFIAPIFGSRAIHISTSSSDTGVVQCECRFRRNRGFITSEFSLYGKVRFVTKDADLVVYVAKPGDDSDIIVEWVDKQTYVCGEWQLVESGENFTVQVVNNPDDADMVIEYGETDHCEFCEPCWSEYNF